MNELIHKRSSNNEPRLSIILLDWGCRDRFATLDWLNQQDAPRGQYELIWVELYDRVVNEVIDKADIVITCNQRGLYHKHIGYNIGLLHARGDLVCVCDSDAVFPADFVSSVFRSFEVEGWMGGAKPLVLMHYEWRTSLLYPEGLSDVGALKDPKWGWWPLIVNEGACVTFRRDDAIRFGGFDEHPSYRGYLCGPYELAWRLINAGYPEIWHDSSVALWHFAHPDPIGSNGQTASLKQLMEKANPHLQGHALKAVEAFSTGRFQPLQENAKIWALRMRDRRIGSELETQYAQITGQQGFSQGYILKLWISLYKEIFCRYIDNLIWKPSRNSIRTFIGNKLYYKLRSFYRNNWAIFRIIKENHLLFADKPTLICEYKGYNLVKFQNIYYGAPHGLELDLSKKEDRHNLAVMSSENLHSLLRSVRKSVRHKRLDWIKAILKRM